jgi:hypothetical protein
VVSKGTGQIEANLHAKRGLKKGEATSGAQLKVGALNTGGFPPGVTRAFGSYYQKNQENPME